jgi:long-chain acyl-CoA synthetase
MAMPESVAEFFLTNYQAHQQERACRQRRGYRTESFSYGEILKMASGFAARLDAQGFARSDRVIIWGENCAEWMAVFFGCVLSGVVVVPLDDGSTVDFAKRVFEQVQAKLLVASSRHLQECSTAGVLIAGVNLEELAKAPSKETRTPAQTLNRDDVLQIVFTSGTTAEPKGVVITHGNVLANLAPLEREIRGYLKYERWVHPLRFLNLLPLSHVFGQFLGLFLPPLLGATVVFPEDLKPAEVVNTIRREQVSVLVSVPRVLQSLKQSIEREREVVGDLDVFRRQFRSAENQHFLRRWWAFRKIRRRFGWKFWAFISGGAALDYETEQFWGRLGYAVIQGYGLTETTSLISVNHPFRLGRGSIGRVLPGREVKLAEDGEILVRGGGVASGYWAGPEGANKSSQQIPDAQGWYHTGDLGALDEAGNLYFKGRKKEVIITPAGLNVYPEDLEAALRRQPEVRDCVVVGIDRRGNAEPCALLILRAEAKLDEVVQRANQRLAEYQRMRIWMEWADEDFPRTNTQKPRRGVIREVVQAKLANRDVESVANRPLTALIERVTGRPAGPLREEATLDDLGLSSLDRVELMSALEERYQVDLSEARFSQLRTVGDLDRMLQDKSESSPSRREAGTGGERAAPYHYPTWTLRWPVTWLRVAAHYLLMRPAILLLGWPRVEGRENLRGLDGPMLVISNHVGDVDPGFILTALPARFRHKLATATGGEALEALRTPGPDRGFFAIIYDRMQWALGVSLLNLFPLPREAGFRRSFAYAGEAVDRGYSILVFPEGRHTTDGRINPFRAGIGLLAANLNIPVLPMRIDGLFEVKQAGKKFAPAWKIHVKIGTPLKFSAGTEPEKIASELQKAVENL